MEVAAAAAVARGRETGSRGRPSPAPGPACPAGLRPRRGLAAAQCGPVMMTEYDIYKVP